MEAMTTMPTEIIILGWSVVLLLVQLVLQALPGVIEFGLAYAFSPRDERTAAEGRRSARASSAPSTICSKPIPAFVALALALAVTGKTGGMGATGAQIWFWARVVYVPVYALGIPYLRTLIWTISVIGLVMMLIALF